MKKCFIYSGYLSVVLITMLLAQSGCYYDKEELLYPGSGICDTSIAKYSTTILPIISASCYSCHAGNFPSAGVKLDTYIDLKANAQRVYGAITHSSGFAPMPQSAPKLNACSIESFKEWIDAGTPQN